MENNKNTTKNEIITSRQNPIISLSAKLGDKKYRDREELFLIDGIKLVIEAISEPSLETEYILLRTDAFEMYSEEIENALFSFGRSAKIYQVSPSAFERVTDEKSPQGIVAAVHYSRTVKKNADSDNASEDDGKSANGSLLLLDGIQNPDNLGAMLRSARAFGMDGAVCGEGCADVYSRRVMRSSMGAALHMQTAYTESLSGYCKKLKDSGRRVIAAVPSEDAESLPYFGFMENDALIIGNEGHGISEAVLSECTNKLCIPMVKGQESLNAASAAAVIFYEMYRCKLLKNR